MIITPPSRIGVLPSNPDAPPPPSLPAAFFSASGFPAASRFSDSFADGAASGFFSAFSAMVPTFQASSDNAPANQSARQPMYRQTMGAKASRTKFQSTNKFQIQTEENSKRRTRL